jgi:hypothetical protein
LNAKVVVLLLVVLAAVSANVVLRSYADASVRSIKPLGDPIDNPEPLRYARIANTEPAVRPVYHTIQI